MSEKPAPKGARQWIARGFTLVEDVVYVGLGLLRRSGRVAAPRG